MGLITHRMRFARPTSVGAAHDLLVRHGESARALAGGQSLIPLMKAHHVEPDLLVDLSAIDDLAHVREEAGGTIEIGAMVRLAQLLRNPSIQRTLPILAEVCASVGDRQVREAATIGGSLAHADPAADLCMLAQLLDAEVVTTRRLIPAGQFFRGPFSTVLDTAEIVIAVRFPSASDLHSYVKLRNLTHLGVPSVAVQRLRGRWRVGLTNVGHELSRALEVEHALNDGVAAGGAVSRGWTLVEALPADAVPLAYKVHMARVLTTRAMALALES